MSKGSIKRKPSEAQLNKRLTSVLLALLESQTFQELRVTGGTSAGLNSSMRKMILRKIKSRAKHARVGFASWVLDDGDKLALVTFNVSFGKAL